jgi:hypothetical protein
MNEEEWNPENDIPAKERVITEIINSDGFSITVIGVDSSAITSETEPYDVIEMPDGLDFVIALSDDFISGLMHGIENPFHGGFAFGLYVGQLATQVLHEIMEDC